MLKNGRYAAPYKSGYRLLQVRAVTRGPLAGKTILMYRKADGKWMSFAFLSASNEVQFFVKFRSECTAVQLDAVRALVAGIASNPREAASLYFRLNRTPQAKLHF